MMPEVSNTTLMLRNGCTFNRELVEEGSMSAQLTDHSHYTLS